MATATTPERRTELVASEQTSENEARTAIQNEIKKAVLQAAPAEERPTIEAQINTSQGARESELRHQQDRIATAQRRANEIESNDPGIREAQRKLSFATQQLSAASAAIPSLASSPTPAAPEAEVVKLAAYRDLLTRKADVAAETELREIKESQRGQQRVRIAIENANINIQSPGIQLSPSAPRTPASSNDDTTPQGPVSGGARVRTGGAQTIDLNANDLNIRPQNDN
jgi:hypothetical protein